MYIITIHHHHGPPRSVGASQFIDLLAWPADARGGGPVAGGRRVSRSRCAAGGGGESVTSAIRVILRADDSSGIIGDAIRALLELHAQVAGKARPPAAKLAA